MVTVSNQLSSTSPIPEAEFESEAKAAFDTANGSVQDKINAFLKALSGRAEVQNYKLVVHVTEIDASTRGPLKTYTGAFWNADQDGAWATHLAEAGLMVTVTWIRV